MLKEEKIKEDQSKKENNEEQIIKEEEKIKDETKNKEEIIKGEGTEFFLVGGFDKINRKGAIKLFKIKGDEVFFLQDIINKIYVAPLNIYKKIGDQSISLSSQSTKSSSQNQFKNDNQSIDNINIEEDTKFKGFEGAVTSIMQSMSSYEIVATCSDGKVSLFSCPNLEIYGKKLFINNS